MADTSHNAAAARSRGLLYGRRKGKTLRARRDEAYRTVLPQHALDLSEPSGALADLFAEPTTGLALEIGFGAGEHLLHQLERQPSTGFIGCEPFVNGMACLLDHVADHPGRGRLRVHEGDARDVIAWLPDASVQTVYLLYPDPWPKLRHEKRRFIAGDTPDSLARIMPTGGELRVATDIDAYKRTTLKSVGRSTAFEATDHDPATPWPDWIATRYEQKALREGRTPSYFSFRRVGVAESQQTP